MAARSQASGGRGRRAGIARAAGAASGGAAGGAKQVANVPRQQGIECLDGLGSGELLEQVGQVRGGLKAIGRGCRNKTKEIGARASSPSFIRLINGITDRIDPGTDRGRTEAYVPAFISPESHIGSGHSPHLISHRPGWRSRHTGPAAGNPALPAESFTRSSMSLPASLAFATALLGDGTMPLSDSCRRTLDNIRRLNPCAR